MAAFCDHKAAPGCKDFKQPSSVLRCVSSLQLAGVAGLHLERVLQKLKWRYTTPHQNLIPETPLLERNQKWHWMTAALSETSCCDIGWCILDSLFNLPAGCQITWFNHCLRKTSMMQISSYKLHSLCSITDFWRLKLSEVSLTCALWKKKNHIDWRKCVSNVKGFYFHLLNISVCKRLLIPYSFQGWIIDTSNYTGFFLTLTGQNPGK